MLYILNLLFWILNQSKVDGDFTTGVVFFYEAAVFSQCENKLVIPRGDVADPAAR